MQLKYVFLAVVLTFILSSSGFSQNDPIKSHSTRIQRMLHGKYRKYSRNTDWQLNRLKEQEKRATARIATLEQDIKACKEERAQIRKDMKELVAKSIKEKKEEKEKIKKDQKDQLGMKEKEIESLRKLQREMEKD
ncbi:MAG TPA: hypothetical protein VHO43_17685 [Ignavibacteriales bacterium]|nr:hypothetical protein [Ignavibacteriales bacterium]